MIIVIVRWKYPLDMQHNMVVYVPSAYSPMRTAKGHNLSIRVERIPNKRGRDSFLLRQSWREGHRIRKKTLANLTDLPPDIIAGFDAVARGGVSFQSLGECVHQTLIAPWSCSCQLARKVGRLRMRDLALAAIVARVIRIQASSCDTATSSRWPARGTCRLTG